MKEAPGDYHQARITHWLTDAANYELITAVQESAKNPLENRVWFNYPGQPAANRAGALNAPSAAARVLDDGSTQLYQFGRNEISAVTNAVDPAGRTTQYLYATNLIDLLAVRQQVAGASQLLSQFTYNSQHRPLSMVDAAGQTNFFGYNTNGQLVAATNALGETLSLAYDANGYLTNITGALPETTTSFTYDDYGRVRTVTDPQGYTLTYDYNALDLPTKVTYPDGTYEQQVYQNLDAVLVRDRMGRWTVNTYDALRHLAAVQDPLGRVTSFDWCRCGSLDSLTDPLGRTTAWFRDVQGRVTAKAYPDGSLVRYEYERAVSRLKTVTDAKNQIATYDYYSDNNLKQVAYANSAVATPGVAFTYDTNYNRLMTMTDGIGTTTYAYHPVASPPGLGAGRLASVDGPLANDTVTYAYDALGRMTNRAIDGVAQIAAFDALGRVTVVTNALGAFTNTYAGVTSRVTTNFFPNGQKTVFGYCAATNDFRLQEIRNWSGSNQLSAFAYTYDATGQIETWTRQADADTPQVWVMDYDPAGQLLGVTVRSNSAAGLILKQFVYGYDQAGNRYGESIRTASTSSLAAASFNQLNQLTALAGVKGSVPARLQNTMFESTTPLGEVDQRADDLNRNGAVDTPDRVTAWVRDAYTNTSGVFLRTREYALTESGSNLVSQSEAAASGLVKRQYVRLTFNLQQIQKRLLPCQIICITLPSAE